MYGLVWLNMADSAIVPQTIRVLHAARPQSLQTAAIAAEKLTGVEALRVMCRIWHAPSWT